MNLNERMNAVSELNLPEYELIDVKACPAGGT